MSRSCVFNRIIHTWETGLNEFGHFFLIKCLKINIIFNLFDSYDSSLCLWSSTMRCYSSPHLSVDGAALLHDGVESGRLGRVLASGGARRSGGSGLVSAGRLWDRRGQRASHFCTAVGWKKKMFKHRAKIFNTDYFKITWY